MSWPTLLFAATVTAAAAAPSDKVRVTDLVDVSFGTINNLTTDAVLSQSVCAHSQSGVYSVTATGGGPGSGFALSAGASTLDYEVQWAGLPGRTSGTNLPAGVATGAFTSAGNQQCNGGPTASLIIILRAAQLQAATALPYSGTLTIMLAPL